MKQKKNDGSVLIIVLLVLAAAAFLILESSKFLRIDYSSAAYQRVVVAGGSLLRSGLTVSKEILLEDIKNNGNFADHKFDNWAKINEFFEEISSSLESGEISGSISAEDGRISLNSLRAESDLRKGLGEIFVRLVRGLCVAHSIEADPNSYLASIKIWLGETDTQSDKDWYASQDPSYMPTGGLFQSPGELLLVRWKGVESEDLRKIFYGAGGIPGLKDFITVWGTTGKINVNTASREIIAALVFDPALRSEFVEAVEIYRGMGENDFASTWYKDIAYGVGVNMVTFPEKALTVKSTVFRVSLTAGIGAGYLNSTTILRRDSGRCVVLFENIH